jgi:hypothetical protein
MLKGILDGSLTLEALRPAQFYTVMNDDGVYKVQGKELNETEYQAWIATLRPQDHIIVFSSFTTKENEPICNAPINPYSGEVMQEGETMPSPRKPVNRPVKASKKSQEREDAQESDLFALPVKKTTGKLSEYSITWGIKENDIYYS